jgi:5-methyltetrahydrofolate--homocysteine methyltransferase
MSLLEKLKGMIIEGNLEEAPGVTGEALAAGTDPQKIIDQGLIAAMDEVGEKFAAGDLFIPEMLLSAKTMESALAVLRPLIAEKGIKAKATVVFGTVEGDVHDIGKNLVIMMMQGAGFEVHDLGTNVSPEMFYQAVQKYQPTLFCMSALLTTTQGAMARTIKYLKIRASESGSRSWPEALPSPRASPGRSGPTGMLQMLGRPWKGLSCYWG